MSDSELEDGEIREEEEDAESDSNNRETGKVKANVVRSPVRSPLHSENGMSDDSDTENVDGVRSPVRSPSHSENGKSDGSDTENGQVDCYFLGKIEKHQEMFFISRHSEQFLSQEDVITCLQESRFVSDSLPKKFPHENPGLLMYLISKDCFGSYKDVGTDLLSPWNTSKNVSPEVKQKWNDVMKLGTLTLRQGRGFNPRNKAISRKVSFLLDKHKNLASPVLFQYQIKDNDSPVPYSSKGVRTTPSQMSAVRSALRNRSTTLAKRDLDASGLNISKKTIYNAATSMDSVDKQRCGRKKATDPAKVLTMACRNPHISFRVCGSEVKDVKNVKEDEPDLEIIQVFPDAISVFIKDCPRREELLSHKRAVSALDTMNVDEQSQLLESFRVKRSASQTIPGFGCQVQVDTTFDISHLLVTTAIGVLDSVVDRKSGKNKMILLGVMLHQHKKSAHHEEFGKRIAAQMLRFSKDRKVPCFLADGETALQEIAKGEPFDECTRLLCDIHTKSNLKTKFKKDGERLAELLFGRKEEIDGIATFFPGLFGALNRDEYDRMVVNDLKNEPELVKWLKHRDFYMKHSLRSKLEAGVFNQWNTTNLTECFNNQIKVDIKNRLPGEELLAYFQKVHKGHMSHVFGAYIGGNSPFGLAEHRENNFRSETDWTAMSTTSKDRLMAKIGLVNDSSDCNSIREKLPDWILQGCQSETVRLLKEVKTLKVGYLDDAYIVKQAGKTDGMATVHCNEDEKSLVCTRLDCKNRSTKKPCAHTLAVLLSWSHEKAESFFTILHEKYVSCTPKQIVSSAIRPSDGGKCPRKGNDGSRKNHARKIDVVSRTTIFEKKMKDVVHSPFSKKRRDDEEFVERTRRGRAVGGRRLFSPPPL